MVTARQELTKIISEKHNSGIHFNEIQNSNFLNNENFGELWKQCSKNTNEKWKEFVKFILMDESEKEYISNQLMRLFFENFGSVKNFSVSTELGTFVLPDRLSLLIILQSMKNDFSKIFHNIKSRMNFDFPKREYVENRIRGKVDWNKTTRNSITKFPLKFYSKNPIRKFDTPENILLLLCCSWIKNDSLKALNEKYDEPLTNYEKNLLTNTYNSINETITHFPFPDIVRNVSGLTNFPRNSPKIDYLRRETNKRIREGKIKNPAYGNLLNWISQYLDLGIEGKIRDKNRFVYESMSSVNFLYEYLIFFEFFKYLKSFIKSDPKLEFVGSSKKHWKIIFSIGGKKIEFVHGIQFKLNNNEWPTWFLNSEPDYSVIMDNKIIAVFDAKNYYGVPIKDLDEKQKYNDAFQKFLPALNGETIENKEKLMERFGKNFSKDIDKYFKELKNEPISANHFCEKREKFYREKHEQLKNALKDETANAKEGQKEAIIKISSYMLNLDVNYAGIIFSNYTDPDTNQNETSFGKTYEFKNTKKPQHEPKFHHNLKYEILHLSYVPLRAKITRDYTVEKMYDAIKFAVESQPPEITT